jgi:photosystem II stability/assembly factor-like uncharacterized protein
VATKCPPSTIRSVVTTDDGNELWVLCQGELPTNFTKLFVSSDGGKSWSLRTELPGSALPSPFASPDLAAMLVALHAGTAVIASNQITIFITHDGGLSWTPVGEDGLVFPFLTFANATDGWAVDGNHQDLWITTDGGAHWQ